MFSTFDAIMVSIFSMIWCYILKPAVLLYGFGTLFRDEVWFDFNVQRSLSRNNMRFSLFVYSAYFQPNVTFYTSMTLISLFGIRQLWLLGNSGILWLQNIYDHDDDDDDDFEQFHFEEDAYPSLVERLVQQLRQLWLLGNSGILWSRYIYDHDDDFEQFHFEDDAPPSLVQRLVQQLRQLWLLGNSGILWLRNIYYHDDDFEQFHFEEDAYPSLVEQLRVDVLPIRETSTQYQAMNPPKRSTPRLESYYSPGRRLRREYMFSTPPPPPRSPSVYPFGTFIPCNLQTHDPQVFNAAPSTAPATAPATAPPVVVTPPPRASPATPPLRGILRRGRGGRSNVRKSVRLAYTVQVREYGIRIGDFALCERTSYADPVCPSGLPVELSDEIVWESLELMVRVDKNVKGKVFIQPIQRAEKVKQLKKWGIVAPPVHQQFSFPAMPETNEDRQAASDFCMLSSKEKRDFTNRCLKARRSFVAERQQKRYGPWTWKSMAQWQLHHNVGHWGEAALSVGRHHEQLAQLPLERTINGAGRVMFRKQHAGASCLTSSNPTATGKRGRLDDDTTVCHARRRLLH